MSIARTQDAPAAEAGPRGPLGGATRPCRVERPMPGPVAGAGPA